MIYRKGRRNHGFTLIEALTVVVVIALLFGMGFLLYRSMRRGARLAQAEARLKQVSAGLELYFRDNHDYPDEGADLQAALAPYVDDPTVFDNPLRDDDLPGEDLNQYYRQPSFQTLDRPGHYIVCFPPGSEDDPITVLETGDRVTRRINPGYDAEHLQRDTLVAFLYSQPQVTGDSGDNDGDDQTSEEPPEPPAEPTDDDSPDDYTEEPSDGEIAARGCSWVTFDVRATDLTWGRGGPDVPITISMTSHSDSQDGQPDPLFGGGPVAAGQSDSTLALPDQTSTLTFHAEYQGWSATYSSDGDPTHVLTLRNGDQPVEFDPYTDPVPVDGALADLIDPNTGQVTVEDNQVLYLAEMGSTSAASPHYDFQDAIVLATFTDADPAECDAAAEEDSQEGSGDQGGFTIDDGDVATQAPSNVLIRVVGTQFGYADGTMVDVGCSAQVDDPQDSEDGDWFAFNDGAPVEGGEEYTDDSVSAGTRVTVEGEVLGAYERWLWTRYGYPLSYRSNESTDQVLVYQSGDQPPDFAPGYPCQASAGDLVAPYIDPQTGVVTIEENQVIYLWDFNPTETGEGIDYQDLIVLATAEATGGGASGGDAGGQNGSDTPGGPGAAAVVDAVFSDDGTTVTCTSTKDLSNVVLDFGGGDHQKFEGLHGKEDTFSGTGANEGQVLQGVWIKSGNNASGDGPGYGQYVANTPPPQGGNQGQSGGGQKDQPPADPPANQGLHGRINLNPRNNWDFHFELEKPDGTTITREDLHDSRGDLTYAGGAVRIEFCPKGNGNQNSLTLDGEPYSVRNGTNYTITSDDMTVNLYNDRADKHGKAMGRWWIEIDASNAEIDGQRGNKHGPHGGPGPRRE